MTSKFEGSKIIYIDLSKKESTWKIDNDLKRKYLGGWGGNAKLIYDLWEADCEAYSPDNPIILGAGSLSGTLCPGSSKSFLTTRCPSSGTVTTAVGSLSFSGAMHWAGCDHIVIKGKAERPVYITIFDDDIEIVDANSLWGKTISETTDELYNKYRHKDLPISIACIGPAGEKLVNTSILFIDKLATFGRSNGGNFGSKNLKAIVVGGSKGLKPFSKKRFMQAVKPIIKEAWDDPNRKNWCDLGLYFIYKFWLKGGYFIKDNWKKLFSDREALNLYGEEEYLRFKRSSIACLSCLACDKAIMRIPEGEKKGMEFPLSTTIDPAMAFGIRLGVGSMEKAQRCAAFCDDMGIDFMTFSGMLGWFSDIYQKGIISKKETGGYDLSRLDFNSIMEILELTAKNEGFGSILGKGYIEAGKTIGKDIIKYAVQIKGTEPDIDARPTLGVETFGSVVNPRGAHDMPVGGLMLAQGRKPEFFLKIAKKMGFPANRLTEIFKEGIFNLGKYQVYYENYATLLNCMGICFRMQCSRLYSPNNIAELFASLTGVNLTAQELLKSAERAYNLYKAVNVKAGFSRKDDCFPDIWFDSLKAPERNTEYILMDYFKTIKIDRNETEKMLDDYYRERGWSIETSIPSKEKLEELGLGEVYKDLEKYY